jgi:hypothetical protein
MIANIVASIAPVLVNPASTPLEMKQATNQGMANALYFYLNLQKIMLFPPVFPSAGVIATAPPVPGAALCSINVTIPPASTLKTLLDGVVGPGIANPSTDIQFFQAISTWLSAPPVVASINNAISIPPTIFGNSIVNFPLMPSMGTVMFYSMLAAGATGLFSELASINPLEAPFEILSNFVFAGFLANFITPIPTTGTIGSAYSGMTFPLWLMLDCPDWPIGSSTCSDMLDIFGLSDLSDSSIIAKQQEILDGQSDPTSPFYEQPVTSQNCDLIFDEDTQKYSKNPLCTDVVINTILDNGCNGNSNYDKPVIDYLEEIETTSASAETVWDTISDADRAVIESDPSTASLYDDYPTDDDNVCTDLMDSAQIDAINTNFSNVDSNALDTPVVPHAIEKDELETADININVIEPTVTAINVKPTEVFEGYPAYVVTNKS